MSFHYAGRSDADPSRSLFSDSMPQVPGFGHKESRTKKAGRLKARKDSQSRNVQWLLPRTVDIRLASSIRVSQMKNTKTRVNADDLFTPLSI